MIKKEMLKKLGCIFMVIIFLVVVIGCGKPKEINGLTYETYGLLNENDKKNPNIEYEVCWGNVIWGCILVETIIAPIYFFGFSLFNPVGIKGAKPKGVI